MQAKLNLESRSQSGKGVARKLRRAGRVPGVIYGGDSDPVLISMEAQEALHLFQAISVENTILQLSVDGSATEEVLVREIQSHPFRTELIHVDFLRIQAGVAIEVQIPLHLVGTADGVRNEGGQLEQIVHDVLVKCIPSRIPEVLELDITALAIGDALHASDIALPPDVEILLDLDQTVCLVAAPRVLEEEEDVDEEALEGEEGEVSGEAEGDASAADADEDED